MPAEVRASAPLRAEDPTEAFAISSVPDEPVAARIVEAVAPAVMAPPAAPVVTPAATSVPPTVVAAPVAPAAPTSLGAAVLAHGVVRKPILNSDPLAALRRMSQAEKLAFFS
jgi:hypothetical protein